MRCPSCGSDNPEGTKFYGECGASLPPRCPQCGFANLPATKFCRQCGTALQGQPSGTGSRDPSGERAVPDTPRTAVPSAAEGERRQLTVMFCDLVGSTPLAEQLDPEDLRQVILAYQQTCAEQIRRFDGYLARYVGDGLLVYF